MDLPPGSFEAYCLDEAVIYFGMQVEGKLDEAGHKTTKEERKAQAARQKVLDDIFGIERGKNAGFADPALMFG